MAALRSPAVAVRPEKMKICGTQAAAPEKSDENRLLGVVREIIYAGAVSTILLESVDGSPIKILTQNRETSPTSPGDSVALAWSPTHSVIIEN
jgi:ABC-type Fe3+/spermidine/putrescine transport system ATPase subunit